MAIPAYIERLARPNSRQGCGYGVRVIGPLEGGRCAILKRTAGIPVAEVQEGRAMIYFDNAATTFPKPPQVGQAVAEAFTLRRQPRPQRPRPVPAHRRAGVRGAGGGGGIFRRRRGRSRWYSTQNCTHALNLVIHGRLRQGDHVVISDLEHNSVLRPVTPWPSRG